MSTNLFLFLQLRTEATFSTLLGVGLSVEDIEPEFMEDRVGSILEGTMDDNVDGVMGSLIVDSILEGGDEKIEFELTVDKAEDSVELRRISLYEDFTNNLKMLDVVVSKLLFAALFKLDRKLSADVLLLAW